ncbi:hypothetical protein DPEC_G00317410 [Dallia pectoralis]|uniref:Uncharacterized protein n=1 Tax=Dallia pectoralis TaxID=75939 RepID=A0ACC2FD75_DALPE|nr:hypothetical protein DPEC_G00317410 [Dallia pectoralis]
MMIIPNSGITMTTRMDTVIQDLSEDMFSSSGNMFSSRNRTSHVRTPPKAPVPHGDTGRHRCPPCGVFELLRQTAQEFRTGRSFSCK